ncbi:hypothetical protein T484DRAFT_1802870, partial [Baffinella frigidus]
MSCHSAATGSFDKLSLEKLEKGLREWRAMMGLSASGGGGASGAAKGDLRLTRTWDKKKEAKGPKHGKAPDGKRHAGGNTWAGGTGGADTAGMGGKGGPYRLDLEDGHPVMQISDEEKANISQEAKEEARKMGQEELAKRLE